MDRYIDADKLKAEIERRQEYLGDHNFHSMASEYDWLLDIVESLQQEQPSLPSNLDEAAEEYSERLRDGRDKLYAFHGFRDGAMWRDSQVQRLSNDIDRAAELSANDAMIKRQFPSVVYNTGLKCFDHSDLIKQFKAGAEWMAGQGWHDITETPSIFGFYLVIHEKGWCVANYMGKGVVCKSGWVEAINHIEIEHPQKWLDLRDLIPKK